MGPVNAHPDLVPPAAVLAAFEFEPESLVRATSGLMNPTWYATSRQRRRARAAARELDFLRGGQPRHCRRHGAPGRQGVGDAAARPNARRRAVVRAGQHIWRVLTRIDGICRDALETPAQARAAGRIVAEFHRAVSDLDHRFRNRRLGVHDTPRHLRTVARGPRRTSRPSALRCHRAASRARPRGRCRAAAVTAEPRPHRARRPEDFELDLRARRGSRAVPHRSRHARPYARRTRARRRAALVVQPGDRGRRSARVSCASSSTPRSPATPKRRVAR